MRFAATGVLGITLGIALGIILGTIPVDDTLAADAHKGETLAKRWCSACHVVSSDQQRGNTQAPPFSTIAKKSELDEARITTFLLAGHTRMPDMNLTRAEAADLAAYIKTQQ